MREIYSFTLNKKEVVDEVEITKDEKGTEVKTTKKVEKSVPHKYIVKKPSRAQGDDCELFRAATESEYIKRGILPAALIEKRLLNDGDIYTEQQKTRYEELNKNFVTKKTEYDELLKVVEAERTEEQKKNIENKIKELAAIIDEIQVLKNVGSSLYNRSAEVLARNRATLWLTLMLSYEEKDGKTIPVFGDGDFEKKLAAYDKFEEEEDEYVYDLIQTLSLISSMWYMGRASTKEDFDAFLLIKNESKEMGVI
jgi:hypothetical protein